MAVPALSPGQAIETIRPRTTDTTSIVPVQRLQFEAGLTFDVDGSYYSLRQGAARTVLRYGVTPRLEARLELPSVTSYRHDSHVGLGTTAIAASYRLGRVGPASFAIQPRLVLPTGDAGSRPADASPSLSLTAEARLGGGWSLASTVGATHVEYVYNDFFFDLGRRKYEVYQATGCVERAFGDRLSVFAECVGNFYREFQPGWLANGGARFRLSERTQVDLSYFARLNNRFPPDGLGVGYSVRF